MFNWLGNLFPYSDLHSLNLDWILSKMKETAAQAAKAIADSANALAQVIEAKTAAQNAQTAAQNAQTAANNAQTAANNAADSAENAVNVAQQAKSAAQTAQNTANTAQSAAQTAQSAANTAQSAAENAQNTANTAQSAAETAQSAAETAQADVNTLKAKFPITTSDIKNGAVTTSKLDVTTSYLRPATTGKLTFPQTGHADFTQITAGIDIQRGDSTFDNLRTSYLQFAMDISEPGATSPNTKFCCVAPLVNYIQKSSVGIVAIAPILIVNKDTNETFHGFMELSRINNSGNTSRCKVVFESNPNFTENSAFTLNVAAVGATMGRIIG